MPPRLRIMFTTEATRSDSFSRRRPISVKTAPRQAPAATARTGTRSGISAAEIRQHPSRSRGSSTAAAWSPCTESGDRPLTCTGLPSASAARKKAALLQSPSTRTVPGER